MFSHVSVHTVGGGGTPVPGPTPLLGRGYRSSWSHVLSGSILPSRVNGPVQSPVPGTAGGARQDRGNPYPADGAPLAVKQEDFLVHSIPSQIVISADQCMKLKPFIIFTCDIIIGLEFNSFAPCFSRNESSIVVPKTSKIVFEIGSKIRIA